MTRKTNQTSNAPAESRSPAYIAYHVDDRGEKKFWSRIGAAWRHQKGEGLTLQLDLLPVSGGRIILRAPSENTEQEAGA
jgi:hypothetical protein